MEQLDVLFMISEHRGLILFWSMKLAMEAEESRRKHDYYEWVEMFDEVLSTCETRNQEYRDLLDTVHHLIVHGHLILQDALEHCYKLQSCRADNCEEIGAHAFKGCMLLKTIRANQCLEIDSGAFEDCGSLRHVQLANCWKIDTRAFSYCQELEEIYLPSCVQIGNGAFERCCCLTVAYLPECTEIDELTFYKCRQLKYVIAPKCKHISNLAFAYCSNLTCLVVARNCYIDSFAGVLAREPTIYRNMSDMDAYEMWRSLRFSLDIRTKDVPERQLYEHVRKVVICPHANTRDEDAIFTVLNPEDKLDEADEDRFYEEGNHNVN